MARTDERGTDSGGEGAVERPESRPSEATTLKDVVLDSSTSLMSAAPDEFDTKFRWSLQSIAEHVGADRGYVFRAREETYELLYRWSRPDAPACTTETVFATAERAGWMLERLEAFESVQIPAVETLTAAAGDPGDILQARGVRSLVAVPMVAEWELHGVLVFDTVSERREWDEATTTTTLQRAGDMLAQALAQVHRERELERQNDRLEQFAGVISHDLRNPLNVAQGRTALALETGDTGHLAAVETAHERMSAIIEDVLAMAQQGQVLDVDELAPVDLATVARTSWATVATRNATLDVESGPDVVACPDRLQQVFENLFRNAIEHGHDGVTIQVRTSPSRDGFVVEDDGPGIPEAELDAVFEAGYTTSDAGTGLGLNIVADIVRAHGWEIRASHSEMGGARFAVTGVDTVGVLGTPT
jgi:signal transduction histidine kinase